MPLIIGLVAITISIFFLASSFLLIKQQKLKFSKHGFSELGGLNQSSRLFNSSLMLLAISQTVFMTYYALLFNFAETKIGKIAFVLLLTTGIGAGICAIFNTRRNRKIHLFSGGLVFAVSGPAWVLSGITIYAQNALLGTFLVVNGILVGASFAIGFLKSRNMPALYESVFFLSIVITNLTTTLLFPLNN